MYICIYDDNNNSNNKESKENCSETTKREKTE